MEIDLKPSLRLMKKSALILYLIIAIFGNNASHFQLRAIIL